MNWGSVKNLLIAMLVVANLFLLYNISVQNRRKGYLDESQVIDAVELLAERGLTIDLKRVPLQKFNADIYESLYGDDYYDKVSETLSDSKRESRNILPDGGMRIVCENGESFEFYVGFGFIYRKNNNISSTAYTGITAENFGESSEFYEQLGKNRLNKLANKAGEFLNSCRSDETNLSIRANGGFYIESEDCYYIFVSQLINGIPIYGHDVICIFNEDTLVGAYGRWYFSGINTSYKNELYDQVNILFTDFETLMQRQNSTITNETTNDTLPSVTAVSACYVIYWNAEKTALYFIPAWQVDHSDGTTIVYNAANNTEYLVGK
jgi:hypothetical protein